MQNKFYCKLILVYYHISWDYCIVSHRQDKEAADSGTNSPNVYIVFTFAVDFTAGLTFYNHKNNNYSHFKRASSGDTTKNMMLIHVKLNTTSNLHHVNIFIYYHCYAARLNIFLLWAFLCQWTTVINVKSMSFTCHSLFSMVGSLCCHLPALSFHIGRWKGWEE